MRTQTTIALGLVLGSLLVSAVASADAPIPRYGQLPAGTPTFAPKKTPPASIPRGAVPGIFVRHPESANHDVIEVGSPLEGPDHTFTPQATRTCFTEMGGSSLEMARRERDKEIEWGDSGFAAEVPIYRRSKDFPEGGVSAVHTERFEEQNGSAVLEIVDVWVDPATRGARVLAKKTLPLALVGASAYGVRVFAARDDRGKDKLVQFVLVPDAKHREDDAGMLGISSEVHMMARSQCGHLRLALPVTDEGASAQLFMSVLVSETKPDPTAATAVPSEHLAKRRRTDSSDAERKFRTLTAQVSVSKTVRDPEPVLSVSFGWAARESSQRDL